MNEAARRIRTVWQAIPPALAMLCAACTGAPADRRYPADYPSEFSATVTDAEREGRLEIWSTTDRDKVSELLAAFSAKYPQVRVEYREMTAADVYRNFLATVGSRESSGDLLWSSAMDLQIKLVNDGYAQRFVSPERRAIAAWANWKNQAWGVTAEPIVFVYNARLLPRDRVPGSHTALRLALLRQPELSGKVATYDPATSAIGYLLATHDDQADHRVMQTADALGRAQARLLTNSQEILSDVAGGKAVLGTNVIGSYAAEYARRDPNLKVLVPSDYALVVSRIAIIPAAAQHPNAAKVFLTFLLSREGQRLLARHSMPSVRSDVPTADTLLTQGTLRREIRVGPALLVTQDALTKEQFLDKWSSELAH